MDVLLCFTLFLMTLFSALVLNIPLLLALLFGYICFAIATPLAMLGAPLSAISFSFLLYLIPLLGLWGHRKHMKTP